jgi:hypothetical protein
MSDGLVAAGINGYHPGEKAAWTRPPPNAAAAAAAAAGPARTKELAMNAETSLIPPEEKTDLRYLYLVTLVAAVGGFLFGYDLSLISGAD